MKYLVGQIAMLALLSTLPQFHHLQAQKLLPAATVHVEVFGPFGTPVRGASIQFLTADRKRNLSAPQEGSTISNVPYGQYILVASDKGGALAEREVVVSAKEVWVRMGLAFPVGDRAWPGGDLTISGDVIPPPVNPKDWWVRVDGVFLHVSRESPILGSGQFSIGGLEMGTYLVEVFERAKLRYAETLEIDTKVPNTHRRIHLSETPRE